MLGQAVEQRLAQLGEVAVERLRVAALEIEVGAAAAEHDGAEAVPLGLEEEVARFGEGLGQLGEHGLDRRGDGEHAPNVPAGRAERKLEGMIVTLNEVKGTISSMAPFAALRVTRGESLWHYAPPLSTFRG